MPRKICEHLLIAEFDIERGSTIKYQYPIGTGADVSHLADLMLPDRAHNHPLDWTFFILNHNSKVLDNDHFKPKVLSAYVYEYADQEWVLKGGDESTGEIMPMNIHLYPNNISCIANDGKEFQNLTYSPEVKWQTMKPKFCCIITGSGAFGYSFEDELSQDVFLQHCDYMCNKEKYQSVNGESPSHKLHVLNHVKCKGDSTAKRGSIVKALALASTYQFVHVFKPLMVCALDKYYEEQNIKVLEELYNTLNSIEDIPQYSLREKKSLRAKEPDPTQHTHGVNVQYGNITLPLKIPVCNYPDEFEDVSVRQLIGIFKDDTMKLYNAVLLQQRIFFLSLDAQAIDVCNAVLALVQLICPPFFNLTDRAYPYSNLTVASSMIEECKNGYIAGTKNPVFEENTKWWDVIANVDTGLVTLNPACPHRFEYSMDKEFITQVQKNIQEHISETNIRNKFHTYTQKLCDMATGTAEFADEVEKKKWMDMELTRVEELKKTQLFKDYLKMNEETSKNMNQGIDIERHLKKLRIKKDLPFNLIQSIYHDFQQCINENSSSEQINEFLFYCPASQGGVYPIAVLLLHGSPLIRENTVKLLDYLQASKEGKEAVDNLNLFLRITYERQKKSLNSLN